ncbi:hypothetical protein HED22_03395 [Thalassospira sp. HF15]|uniref:hypothetical protein n=1 Tax=Thalassospira sp. HF15 TaxID=2722755 RepID=UPI00142F79F4|nr:hypothetical protein [Thalassospira sp. HF15]NIY74678.1 hypothetical protein [Thalassospira sp. HF15]
MSKNLPPRRGQAPGRFVPTRKVREAVKLTKPVRETPIKRFDRKDVMERDLEKYRAEARARLLKNGFDIPPFLMPKRKIDPDEEDGDQNPDPVIEDDLHPPAMVGPKPTPLMSSANLSDVKKEHASAAAKVKPRRHVYVQNNTSGLVSMFLPQDAQQPVSSAQNGPSTQAREPAAHAAAQKAAIAQEKTAYDEYVESLNGGKTLLDRTRESDDLDGTGGENNIAGRVDDLKEAEVRKSRINLPDSESNWAVEDDLDAKRQAILQKQGKSSGTSKGRSAKGRKQPGEPLSLNKMIARLAAYMIAAVAVGYVLVLTINEFSSIIGR